MVTLLKIEKGNCMNEKLEDFFIERALKSCGICSRLCGLFYYGKQICECSLSDRSDRHPEITAEQYEQITKKISWRFVDGGCLDVHMLSLILTDDENAAMRLLR